MKYTNDEIAVALRRCANGICNDECPCFDADDCDADLMRAGAELLEEDGDA